MHSSQDLNSSSTILMLRPANFGCNPQTLSDNAFQSSQQQLQSNENKTKFNHHSSSIQEQAVKQFDQYVSQLRKAGVTVIVVNDSKDIVKPDAVFPNNWFVADQHGRFILFPMKPVSRRTQRKNPVLDQLKKQSYQINETIDLTQNEHSNKFLQGTGSMILDHQNRIAYACKSQRTNQVLFTKFCKDTLHYQPVFFHAVDNSNHPYYHTNVIMSVCSDFVIICLQSIRDQNQREAIKQIISKSRSSRQGVMKQIVQISVEQINNYCGNVLQVRNDKNQKILTMSSTAHKSFTEQQLNVFKQHCSQIIAAEVPTIQKYGGGSTRCMMAEIFLRKSKQ